MQEENTTDDVIINQEAEPVETENTSEGVTDVVEEKTQDDYYKNKAFEYERKFNRTADELKEIKNMLLEQKQAPNDSAQYSEEQLQAALSSDGLSPEQRSFAQTELRKIQDKKLEERDKRIIQQIKKENQDQQTRAQAEKEVLEDPRYQEAFIKLPNGQVQWKQDSQLAQTIGAYMQDDALKNRPDAVLVAAKLAYADMTAGRSQQELTKVKRQNEQLKSQTMVEGGGKNYNKPSVDPYNEAMQRLKSGEKGAGKSAVKEFLRRRNAK